MKACHVRFRDVGATPELLRTIHEHEAQLQRRLDAAGGCESVLLERASDGGVRASLRLRLGGAVELDVYQQADDPVLAVHAAFEQALRRAQRQTPPRSGARTLRPGLHRASVGAMHNTGTA